MADRKQFRVSVDEAKRMLEAEEAVPLDVIDSGSYQEFDRRIAGAVRIAPEDVGDQFDQLPPEKKILAY